MIAVKLNTFTFNKIQNISVTFYFYKFRRKEKINKEKEDIEKARKSLNKRKPSAASSRSKSNYTDDGSFVKPKVSN